MSENENKNINVDMTPEEKIDFAETFQLIVCQDPAEFLQGVLKGRKKTISKAEFLTTMMNKLYIDWGLDGDKFTMLFRFSEEEFPTKIAFLRKIVSSKYEFEDEELNATLGILIRIRYMLFSLFGDHSAEEFFLKASREILDGKSLMYLMLDPRISEEEGLGEALEFVEHACGW